MQLLCPRCSQPNSPYSITPSEQPGLVTARYSCQFCRRNYRDRWSVASHHFWLNAGGQLADYNATPPGITVHEDSR